jgi:catechol 2,3-dioxygenase-like lactoylglutathione lyase family enzyme
MSLTLDTVSIDCADPIRLATFWCEALGFELDADSDPQGAFAGDPSGRTAGLFFQRVPEPKVGKIRMHLDVRPSESMAAEVARLAALGATTQGRVDVEGNFWTVMLDPEGHEFCVLRGPEDGWSSSQP